MEYQPIKGLDSNSLPHDPGLKLGINDANKKKNGFDQFLKDFREENDIFAHMGAYVIFKGILVENRNIWKWQKFLPYRRNFYFPISRIKFQTCFIIIIF